MAIFKFNSTDGYSTGLTATTVIDADGNIFAKGLSAAGATFSSLVTFDAGISAAGATFGGNIILQNAEFIRNTTNGRIDFMPAPAGSTHYGMYVDTTSWGFGTRLGTVRSSDNALNAAGFLYDTDITLSGGKFFAQNSNGTLKFLASGINTSNYHTLQITLPSAAGSTANALVLMDNTSTGINTTRVPSFDVFNHPNFFIYSGTSGGTRLNANDYIRFEHNFTNGRIISGGTSGISLEPGSGILGISGGLSAAGGTFTTNVQAATYTETSNTIRVTNNARSWFL